VQQQLLGTDVELSDDVRARLVDLVIRGMGRGEPDAALGPAVDAGLVLVKGPVSMPTPAATALVGSWLVLPADGPERDVVTRTFHAFLPVNRRLRDLCTAWQCRPDGSMNDHGDAGYDAAIRDRLDDVHDSLTPLLTRFATALPRTAAYPARFEAALAALDGGDPRWFAAPLIDSYHTVWMQLHQELILTLGLTRSEDEALEARLVAGAQSAP
jgi:hypothetical protein